LAAHRPLGAYDIINHLAQLTGRSPAPISVYRALDHLVEQGMVHRLASRNAYLACGHGHDGAERVAFLICDACGVVSEVSSGDLARSLGALARGHDFETRQSVIELAGRCGACAHSASQDE
jgi:Fur family zinc uptake transcriptional regulator